MYTFTRWVATPENCLARAAVQRVADCVCSRRRRREANPLFLHGPAGTGKTHLVSALATDVSQRCPDLVLCLMSAGDLELQLRASGNLPSGGEAGTDDLPAAWHSDLLIVEGLQHLTDRTAEALAQLCDGRLARRQQMVFTATVGPAQLRQLPGRLTSRLGCGLVVGLEPLSPASRLAVLRDKAQRRQLALAPDVLAWLAEHTGGSVRQLEGALTRLEALARLQARPLDVATVAAHLGGDGEASRPTVERIAHRVSRYFQLEPRQLQSRRRCRVALVPRQVSMYLARQLTPLSLEQIGAYFGGRDHSTVLHACRKVERALAQDAALSGMVRQLHADLA
jgi:chromosomal replication initiator protein